MVMQCCLVLPHSLVGTQLMIGRRWCGGALDSIVKSIQKRLTAANFFIDHA